MICGRPVHEASFRYGFATDFFVTTDRSTDAAEYLRALFASPAGPYVRGLTIAVTNPAQLEEPFVEISSAARRATGREASGCRASARGHRRCSSLLGLVVNKWPLPDLV